MFYRCLSDIKLSDFLSHEIISVKEATDCGLNKKGHYSFDTELEYEFYCVEETDY